MENKTSVTPYGGPVWLEQFITDCNKEALIFQGLGTRSLKGKGRLLIWNVCKKLNCFAFGIPGQACRFMESYMEYFLRKHKDQHLTKELVDAFSPNVLLVASVCVNLAAKTQSDATKVGFTFIRGLLAVEGHPHTIQELTDMEAELLTALEFRVPQSTSMEIAQLIAEHLYLGEEIVSLIDKMIDTAELYRHRIDKAMHYITLPTNMIHSTQRVRTLHLSAGTIAAAVQINNLLGVTDILAAWLQIPVRYLECLREVIIKVVANAEPFVEATTIYRRPDPSAKLGKRKHAIDEYDECFTYDDYSYRVYCTDDDSDEE